MLVLSYYLVNIYHMVQSRSSFCVTRLALHGGHVHAEPSFLLFMISYGLKIMTMELKINF